MVALIITELLMALEYSGTQLGWMFQYGSVEWISGLCNDLSMNTVNLVKLLPSFLRGAFSVLSDVSCKLLKFETKPINFSSPLLFLSFEGQL